MITCSKPLAVNRSSAACSIRGRTSPRIPRGLAHGAIMRRHGEVGQLRANRSVRGRCCRWHWVSLTSAAPPSPSGGPHARDAPRRRRDHRGPCRRAGGGSGRGGVPRRGGLHRRHVRRLLISAIAVSSPAPVEFDPGLPWRRARSIALRPEPFGALIYHFGNRKLSFLKSKTLVAVVEALADHPSAAATLSACGVPEQQRRAYEKALGDLARSQMIEARETPA